MSAPLPFSFVLSPPLLASLLLAILPALFLRSSALFPSASSPFSLVFLLASL